MDDAGFQGLKTSVQQMVDIIVSAKNMLCRDCDWHGWDTDLRRSTHPFIDGEQLAGCPKCGGVTALARACDIDGCGGEVWFEGNGTVNHIKTCKGHWPSDCKY